MLIHTYLSSALIQVGLTHFLMGTIAQMNLVILFIIFVPFTVISVIRSLYFIGLEVDKLPYFIQYSADSL